MASSFAELGASAQKSRPSCSCSAKVFATRHSQFQVARRRAARASGPLSILEK